MAWRVAKEGDSSDLDGAVTDDSTHEVLVNGALGLLKMLIAGNCPGSGSQIGQTAVFVVENGSVGELIADAFCHCVVVELKVFDSNGSCTGICRCWMEAMRASSEACRTVEVVIVELRILDREVLCPWGNNSMR